MRVEALPRLLARDGDGTPSGSIATNGSRTSAGRSSDTNGARSTAVRAGSTGAAAATVGNPTMPNATSTDVTVRAEKAFRPLTPTLDSLSGNPAEH